ncbi:hypothetical protein QFC21_002244 [Naganishia friedmannii]|uniref:Uncharacterized protein n=1 Tax=Naganishia friedmannii TaxID=89922 RepID=A0ACC2VY40_9TREE|nr:hypothetical protein QFC21_002244 [Naganishia friedmannii]
MPDNGRPASNAANTQNIHRQTRLESSGSSVIHISQTSTDIIIQARQELSGAAEGIILVNPLSWQLSSSSTPSLDDVTIPGISHQPKAVIASAFPVSSGSNYFPGIRVPAGWSFSIGFHAIFSAPSSSDSFLTYILRLQDGSELPGWMEYSAEYMTLSGVIPWSDASPRIVYRLRLIGALTSSLSDGSCGSATTATVAQSFTLLVAQHTFDYLPSSSAQPGSTVLNMTTGGEHTEQPLSFGVDAGYVAGIFLDGAQITESDIKDVTIDASAAEWARITPPTAVSPRSLTLSSTKGSKGSIRSDLPLTLTNNYGETLQVVIKLNYQETVFRYGAGIAGWWSSVELTIGQDFTVPRDQNLTRDIKQQQQQQQCALEVESLPSWISLHLDSLAVSGTVPASIANQTLVTLAFRYIDPETFAVSRVKWNLTLFSPPTPNSGPGTGNTIGTGNTSGSATKGGISRAKIIAIAVLSSLLGLVLLLAIAWFARKLIIARMLERNKWASVLRPLHGRGGPTNGRAAAVQTGWDSPPSFTSNLKGQKFLSYEHAEESSSQPLAPLQPAYHRASSYQKRPSSPSNMLKSFIETAMLTPTKKARKMVAEMKDRSLKRYTRSFMSYPIDYPIPANNTPDAHVDRSGGEQDTSATELVSICHPAAAAAAAAAGQAHAPPSPSPHRPTSVTTSLAPFPFFEPPLSGLPSTAFTSDSFLHGPSHQTTSPASWEDPPPNAVQVSHMRYLTTTNMQYYAGSADSIHGRLTIANPESHTHQTDNNADNDHGGDHQPQQPPLSNQFFLAELCHQQSTILRSRDPTTGFPYSITSVGDSVVNAEERYM